MQNDRLINFSNNPKTATLANDFKKIGGYP